MTVLELLQELRKCQLQKQVLIHSHTQEIEIEHHEIDKVIEFDDDVVIFQGKEVD